MTLFETACKVYMYQYVSYDMFVRMLLELSSGLSTCSDRSERHSDLGCVLSLTHHMFRQSQTASPAEPGEARPVSAVLRKVDTMSR